MITGFFSCRKKNDRKIEEVQQSKLKIDLHSHLIPGIDDGARNMEESLEMLQAMSDLGYQKVITTPHVMADAYQNSSRKILDGLQLLREASAAKGIEIEIEAAAEYYMDEELLSRLEENDILTLGKEFLLFETSYYSKPLNFEEVVYEIQAKGYKALLAHPERYRYITNPHKEFERLKTLGIYFQLDINSLGGYYGNQAKEHADLLCDWEMVEFLGSDIHRRKQVDFLKKSCADPRYQRLLDSGKLLNTIL